MKKLKFALFPALFLLMGTQLQAQQEKDMKKGNKETEEIIIRKKGPVEEKMIIQIDGDEVLINGKPMAEFKDDGVTIQKKKIIVRDGKKEMFGDDKRNFEKEIFEWNDDKEKSAFLGVTTEKTNEGAIISADVSKETAAGKAGLQKGDIITNFDGKKIDGPQSLFEAVNEKKPNDEVKILIKRNSKEKKINAILQERKTSFSKTYSFSGPDGSFKTFTMPGMPDLKDMEFEGSGQLDNLQFNMNNFPGKQKLGLKIQDTEDAKGVKVLEVEDSSAAATAGLKKDDILVEIGGKKVTNTDEAREFFQDNREKGTYLVKALRNGSEMNFTIKIPKKLKTANL